MSGLLGVAGGGGSWVAGGERYGRSKKLESARRSLSLPPFAASPPTPQTPTKPPKPPASSAEATDVANGVLDGLDAIVLGAETLRGRYPIETVATIVAICRQARGDGGGFVGGVWGILGGGGWGGRI